MDGWKYYNHAMIPTTQPHEEVDTIPIYNKKIWKMGKGTPLLARWTSHFDCGHQTEWWYCIKDDRFDLANLNAKRRYEINRGLKNVEVLKIDPNDYAKQLAEIIKKAYAVYPKKYRPQFNKGKVIEGFQKTKGLKSREYWGIFDKETGSIIGYCVCRLMEHCVNLVIVKILPHHLKTGANAALIYKLLEEYINSGRFRYIYDGERNVVHQTNYQAYLEKYFGFRKAYCKLHLRYKPIVALIVKILYPLRKIIKKFDGFKVIYNISSILDMEEIKRSFEIGCY